MSLVHRSRSLMLAIGVLLVVLARPWSVPAAGATATSSSAPVVAAGTLTLDGQTAPSDGQTIPTSPAQLSLVFSAPLAGTPGVVVQRGTDPVGSGPISRGDDAQTWYVGLPTPLTAGTYKVTWTADGQTGSYSFTIGTADPNATPTTLAATTGTTVAGTSATTAPATASSSSSDPSTAKAFNVIARWLSYLAIGSLVGGLVLIALAWPEGVEYVLTVRFLRIMWGIALVATMIHLACSRAVLMNESLGSSLSPTSWSDLTDNAAGLAQLARFVLLLACGWVIAAPERAVDEATQIPALLPALLATATFGFTRAQDGLDLFVTPAAVVHAVAFAVWFGGLVLLWRVVLAGSGERDLVDAVRGFSRIATPALLAILLSGVLLTAKLVGGASELLGSGYGRLLLLKTLFVAGMAYAGMVNRQTVHQRLARIEHLPGRTAVRLRRAIGTEMLAGVVVLGLTGWMVGSTPQGLPEQSTTRHVKPALTTPIGNDNVKLEVGVGPAKVGLNDITIDVLQPAQGLVDLTLRFDPVDAYVASVVISVTPTLTGKGQMIVTGVPLDAAGKWVITASGDNTKGKLGETQAAINISPADGAATAATTTTVVSAATTGG